MPPYDEMATRLQAARAGAGGGSGMNLAALGGLGGLGAPRPDMQGTYDRIMGAPGAGNWPGGGDRGDPRVLPGGPPQGSGVALPSWMTPQSSGGYQQRSGPPIPMPGGPGGVSAPFVPNPGTAVPAGGLPGVATPVQPRPAFGTPYGQPGFGGMGGGVRPRPTFAGGGFGSSIRSILGR
jgi:hypothetical protein